MKRIIFLVLTVLLTVLSVNAVNVSAATFTEIIAPPPPTVIPPIPLTAKRDTTCIGADANNTVACNVVYTWRTKPGRFWVNHQRNFGFLYSNGVVTSLTPAAGKTDINIRGINAQGQVYGSSMGAKASLPVGTVWTAGVPTTYSGSNSVDQITADGRVLLDYVRVVDSSGNTITPPSTTAVYALNDFGDGVAWFIDPNDPFSEHIGSKRFSTPLDDAVFLTQNTSGAPNNGIVMSYGGKNLVSINNRGQVTLSPGLAYAGDDTLTMIGGINDAVTLFGQNNNGDFVGRMVRAGYTGAYAVINGAEVLLNNVVTVPAGVVLKDATSINANGLITCVFMSGTEFRGCMISP